MVSDASDMILVIDNGSDTLKAGFTGNDAPSTVFPTVVGLPRRQAGISGTVKEYFYTGTEAQAKRDIVTLKNPVYSRIGCNWNGMEIVSYYIISFGFFFQTLIGKLSGKYTKILKETPAIESFFNRPGA